MALMIASTCFFAPIAANAAPFMENDVDRWGADYRQFALESNSAGDCAKACAGEAECHAWTFVKAGVAGPSAMCRLKSAVPHGKEDPCCISGVAAGASAGVLAGYPSANETTVMARGAPAGVTAALRKEPRAPSPKPRTANRFEPAPDPATVPAATGAPIDIVPPSWSGEPR